MRVKIHRIAILVVVALLFAGPSALAKKGGGGTPGGGGDGDTTTGIPDADVEILYQDDATLGALWKGDDAGNVERVTSFSVFGASFGPAGTTSLAFSGEDLGQGIWVVDDFSGSGLRQVTPLLNLRSETSWSNGSDTPLGEELIAYIDEDPVTGGPYQLFVTTLSGDVTQLTFGAAWKANPCWNPADGSQLLVTKLGGYGDMWLLDLELDQNGELVIVDNEGAVDLKAGTALEGEPVLDASFSPDGTKIVFLADDPADSDGYSDVWVYELATRTFTCLTTGDSDLDIRYGCCVRDDGRILFSAISKRKSKLFVMEADGSNIRPYGGASGQQQYFVKSRP